MDSVLTFPVLALLLVLLAALLASCLPPRGLPTLVLAIFALNLIFAVAMVGIALASGPSQTTLFEISVGSTRLPVTLRLDLPSALAMLASAAALLLGVAATCRGIDRGKCRRFAVLSLLMIAALNGALSSGDLIALLISLEALNLCLLLLLSGNGSVSPGIAFRVWLAGEVTNLCLYATLLLAVSALGSADLRSVSSWLPTAGSAPYGWAVLLVCLATLLRCGLFPLHAQLLLPLGRTGAASGIWLAFATVLLPLSILIRLASQATLSNEALASALVLIGIGSVMWGGVLALASRTAMQRACYLILCNCGIVTLGLGLGSTAGVGAAQAQLLALCLVLPLLILAAAQAHPMQDGNTALGKSGRLWVNSIALLAAAAFPPTIAFAPRVQFLTASMTASTAWAVPAVLAGLLATALGCLVAARSLFGSDPAPSDGVGLTAEDRPDRQLPLLALGGLLILGTLPLAWWHNEVLNAAVRVLLPGRSPQLAEAPWLDAFAALLLILAIAFGLVLGMAKLGQATGLASHLRVLRLPEPLSRLARLETQATADPLLWLARTISGVSRAANWGLGALLSRVAGW